MPCVFPVLGIKVMGFVEHAHGDARAMRLQGAIFSAGVVLSFLALAGLMLALRAGGTQLGWGFQLQSPVVVTLLAALFFVLALNLSGVFEWGAFAQSITSSLSAKGRYADAFLSGVLATVVATPCTAPFMGAAVGFTLTQDAALSLAIFATLGAGMALPVLLLSLFPALLKRLPKPGAWMETFKQVLAFPLYATVAWLAWVLGAQAGNDAVLALLAGLVLVAMGAWMYGRWARRGRMAPRARGDPRGRRPRRRVARPADERRRDVPVVASRRAAVAGLVAGKGARPHRGGQAGVRRFHRRVVRHLPGQQARRAAQRRRGEGLRRARRRAAEGRLDAAGSAHHRGARRARPQRRAGLRALSSRRASPAPASRGAHAGAGPRRDRATPGSRAAAPRSRNADPKGAFDEEGSHAIAARLRPSRRRARQRPRRASPRPPSP